MQKLEITTLKRLFKFDWSSTLLATADPYLVWADLTDASAIQSPTSENTKVKSVRLFVEKESYGTKTFATEDQTLDGLEQRLLAAATSSQRVELSSPFRSPGEPLNWKLGITRAPNDGAAALTGTVLAVIDFGCPFAHSAFRAKDSAKTRVRYLWDQDPNRTVRPVPPPGLGHQIKLQDFASQVPPSNFSKIHSPQDAHFFANFKTPAGADFAYWFAKQLPSKFEPQTGNLETQLELVDDLLPLLSDLKLSKYWTPPFAPIPGVVVSQPINYGRQLTPAKIDSLLREFGDATEAEIYAACEYDDLTSATSHGAHILSTATGWPYLAAPVSDPPPERDAASNVDVIFVQLPATTVADTSGNSLGGYVNDALEYILARTADDSRVVVNLSYGCYAGPHDGSSLIEKAMDAAIERGKQRTGSKGFDVVVAAGNSFQAGCHAMLKLKANKRQTLRWAIQPDDETWSFVEIWYRDSETVNVSITPPFATQPLGPAEMNSVLAFGDHDTPLCTIVHSGNASERNGKINRMALIAVAPTRSRDGRRATAPYGVWTIGLKSASDVKVDAWIERDDPILVQAMERRQSVFVTKPQDDDFVDKDYIYTGVTKYQTINGIATGEKTIPVGSIVGETGRPSRYSAAAAKTGGKRVEGLCPADEATVLAGRLAFGNYGSGTFRRTGTSVAAAMYSRELLNAVAPNATPPVTPAAAENTINEGNRAHDQARASAPVVAPPPSQPSANPPATARHAMDKARGVPAKR